MKCQAIWEKSNKYGIEIFPQHYLLLYSYKNSEIKRAYNKTDLNLPLIYLDTNIFICGVTYKQIPLNFIIKQCLKNISYIGMLHHYLTQWCNTENYFDTILQIRPTHMLPLWLPVTNSSMSWVQLNEFSFKFN